MRIQALYDLQQEIDRLFIAGSKFAQNDPRLSKHVPLLNKLGEQSSVFKKLAQDVAELIETDSSAVKLLDISILLYSILFTQGEDVFSDEEAEQKPNVELDELNTNASYADLKPVIKALTESKQGRLAIIADAQKAGIFNDFRTYQYLNLALADKYGELCDCIEYSIIPKIGNPMLPFILNSFNNNSTVESKTADTRRLRLLIRLNYAGIEAKVNSIMAGSNPQLQAGAITYLMKDQANNDLILALADDKHKAVREAAFEALAIIGSAVTIKRLVDLLTKGKKTDKEALIRALGRNPITYYADDVFALLNASANTFTDLVSTSSEKEMIAAIDDLNLMVGVISHDNSEAALKFISALLLNKKFHSQVESKKNVIGGVAARITTSLTANLARMANPEAISLLKEICESNLIKYDWMSTAVRDYFLACSKTYTKEQLFDQFAPYYKAKNTNLFNSSDFFNAYGSTPKSTYLSEDLQNNYECPKYSNRLRDASMIDSRWIDLFLEHISKYNWTCFFGETLWLILLLDGKTSKRVQELIIDKFSSSSTQLPNDFVLASEVLIESGNPNAFDEIFNTCAQTAKSISKNHNKWPIWRLSQGGIIDLFPKKYAAKFLNLSVEYKIPHYEIIANKIEQNPA